jgi:8-oxo-dGTP diphosphatase
VGLKSLQRANLFKNSMSSAHLITVEVVAGLIFEQGRLLVCQRNAQSAFPLKWEFPGGKVEKDEAHENALRRELKEELSIAVHQVREVFRHQHLYPKVARVNLRFFRIMGYSGQVKNLVFQQVKWVSREDLLELDFLEADLPLIERLAF